MNHGFLYDSLKGIDPLMRAKFDERRLRLDYDRIIKASKTTSASTPQDQSRIKSESSPFQKHKPN